MANKNSLVIQDLTYTQQQYGVAVTVTYVNGSALAVSVSGTAITVTIITGTSTATQIAAAVNASADAAYLVSAAVSGTGATVQTSCVSAAFSGGAAVAKARLTVDATMVFTADTAGTAGNSIRLRFTSGGTAGSEVVSVSSSDISVQIEDGVTTFDQLKTAIEASGGAAALVDISGTGIAFARKVQVASLNAYTALSGGLAAAAATLVNQDLTHTAGATGVTANGKTVTYVNDGTAGAETVSVSSGSVTVHIESGVSTATQIRTALQATGAYTALYTCTVSGTGSTAQVVVNAAPLASAVGEGALTYYITQATTALTASFVNFNFAFHASVMVLTNDETSGSKVIVGSFDGVNTAFTLNPGESLTLDPCDLTHVFLKYSSAAPAYRLEAMRTRG